MGLLDLPSHYLPSECSCLAALNGSRTLGGRKAWRNLYFGMCSKHKKLIHLKNKKTPCRESSCFTLYSREYVSNPQTGASHARDGVNPEEADNLPH